MGRHVRVMFPSSQGAEGQPPLYARVLHLRHINPGPVACLLLFESVVAVSALLAIFGVVSWWAVAALPLTVAAMVKLNDVVAGIVENGRRPRPASAQPKQTKSAPIKTIKQDTTSQTGSAVDDDTTMDLVPIWLPSDEEHIEPPETAPITAAAENRSRVVQVVEPTASVDETHDEAEIETHALPVRPAAEGKKRVTVVPTGPGRVRVRVSTTSED